MFVYPDFYDEFECTASNCRHSCCRGWEIDIDAESMERYRRLPQAQREWILSGIDTEGEPHFRMTEENACTFLRADGLCRMICELGEESLCDICYEHPRFYNELGTRTECGLGLCCEEAVRLLLERDAPLALIEEAEEGDEAPCGVILLREKLFSILAEDGVPLAERAERVMRTLGGELRFDVRELARFCLTLERMDESWTALLLSLTETDAPISPPEGRRYERLCEYFLYRHFALGGSGEELKARAGFSFACVWLLAALEQSTPTPLSELVRLCSAEIEYSDRNVDAILAYLREQ